MEFIASLLRAPQRPRPSPDTKLAGPHVMLRMGDCGDWKMWRNLRDMSRDFLVPWEPAWPADALSYGFYCSLLRRHWREWRQGTSFAFSIFSRGGPKPVLVGGITLGDVAYGAVQKGTLGYWIGRPYAGLGLMTEAVGLVCGFAFGALNLQRVEATCLPHNEPSKALLRRAGFEEEGYAKAYMQINGKREDHILWGKANPAFEKKTTAV